jgi:hypothetical protein
MPPIFHSLKQKNIDAAISESWMAHAILKISLEEMTIPFNIFLFISTGETAL